MHRPALLTVALAIFIAAIASPSTPAAAQSAAAFAYYPQTGHNVGMAD